MTPAPARRRTRWLLIVALVVGGVLGLVELKERVYLRGLAAQAQLMLLEPALSPERLGHGGPAEDLTLADPMGMSLGPEGDLYISDRGRNLRGRVIWRIDSAGLTHIVAGTGKAGAPRVGTSALDSPLGGPESVAFDSQGRLHFVDSPSHQVFRIEPDGRLALVAGNGNRGYGGDAGKAVDARLHNPADIAFDADDNLYIADVYNHRVRRVTPSGTIETVAGTGTVGYSGDGGPARNAELNHPWGLTIAPISNDLLIADGENHVLRRVDANGIITTIAGTGEQGYSGDGGSALQARFDVPQSLVFGCDGSLFIGDEHNHAVRVLRADGTVDTVLGNGELTFQDEEYAGPRQLNDPENIAVLCDGSLYVTDGDNGRVLRLGPDGRLFLAAGRHARRWF